MKIIQFQAMPTDEFYQGMVLGLGDDGVIYQATTEGWVVYISAESKGD